MIYLQDFGLGWQSNFEHRIQTLKNSLTGVRINNVQRYKGMLRINVSADDEDTKYIADCVVYCIERKSVRVCELCGKYGVRRKSFDVKENNDIESTNDYVTRCLNCFVLEYDKHLTQ